MAGERTFRIGHGYDVHPLVEGRELILGGAKIPHAKGLEGHSDADVLLHAIIDAVLGALAWGDIGSWFPDADPQFAGADSATFLTRVWARAVEEGWVLENCDTVVLAEQPKLKPYVEGMCQKISGLLGALRGQVSVKATTTERLGFVGREEGIAASAVVLLSRGSRN